MLSEYEYAHNAHLEKQVYTCQDCFVELRRVRKTLVFKYDGEDSAPKKVWDKRKKLFHLDYICVPCWRKDKREHTFLWRPALRAHRERMKG